VRCVFAYDCGTVGMVFYFNFRRSQRWHDAQQLGIWDLFAWQVST
jgi:hypothetical protein